MAQIALPVPKDADYGPTNVKDVARLIDQTMGTNAVSSGNDRPRGKEE